MIKETKGNLLMAESDIICHQVNCKGIMGGGIAKQIKDDLLSETEFGLYKAHCKMYGKKLLGTIQFHPEKDGSRSIANLFGENIPSGCGLDTDYNALEKCLRTIEIFACKNKLTVAVPGFLGCGLAGGDWNHVYNNIIVPIFVDSEVELTIVYWDKEGQA